MKKLFYTAVLLVTFSASPALAFSPQLEALLQAQNSVLTKFSTTKEELRSTTEELRSITEKSIRAINTEIGKVVPGAAAGDPSLNAELDKLTEIKGSLVLQLRALQLRTY